MCWQFCTLSMFAICAVAAPVAEERPETPAGLSDTIEIDGQRIRVSPSAKRGEVLIVQDDARAPLRVALPRDAGEITEIRANSWIDNGMVIAIETTKARQENPPERSYYWLTLLPKSQQERKLTVQAVAKFHTGTTNFDIVGVRTSAGWGDLVYVILIDPAHLTDLKPAGLMFVHPCPIAPVPGALYDLQGQLRER